MSKSSKTAVVHRFQKFRLFSFIVSESQLSAGKGKHSVLGTAGQHGPSMLSSFLL